jgi:hypothetical protein
MEAARSSETSLPSYQTILQGTIIIIRVRISNLAQYFMVIKEFGDVLNEGFDALRICETVRWLLYC